MIIIEVMGGLGNQMQQYALYQKMKHLGKEVKLDISWFRDEKKQEGVLARRKLELEYFVDLPMEICTREEKERLIGTDTFLGKVKRKLFPGQNRHFYESDMYHPEIFDFEDMYLSGYWACEKYYADILPELRSLIKFPELFETAELKRFTEKISEKTGILSKDVDDESAGSGKEGQCCGKSLESAKIDAENEFIAIYYPERKNIQTIARMKEEISVSIHIRRGDYLDPENTAMFGGICTEDYYEAAIRYVLTKHPDAHFYIFSDDSAYVREKYSGPAYTIVDWNVGENSFYDILLMSSCKHNICANSTFSFWGARLNANPDKIMVRPAKHKNSQQIIPEVMHELWDNWVLIDGIGGIV